MYKYCYLEIHTDCGLTLMYCCTAKSVRTDYFKHIKMSNIECLLPSNDYCYSEV